MGKNLNYIATGIVESKWHGNLKGLPSIFILADTSLLQLEIGRQYLHDLTAHGKQNI